MIKLRTFALLEKGSIKDARISQSYSTHNFNQINGSFLRHRSLSSPSYTPGLASSTLLSPFLSLFLVCSNTSTTPLKNIVHLHLHVCCGLSRVGTRHFPIFSVSPLELRQSYNTVQWVRVPASGHQVRCIAWVQMGTFNTEIGFLCGLKFFALNIFCGEYLQSSLHLML